MGVGYSTVEMDFNTVELDTGDSGDNSGVFTPEPTLNVLNDLNRLYEEKLSIILQTVISRQGQAKLVKLRPCQAQVINRLWEQQENELLRSWVRDLREQTSALAHAVEELETIAVKRVHLLNQQKQCAHAEQRKQSEIVNELQTEKVVLQRKLTKKDSDLRGMVEVLRRLRDMDGQGSSCCSLQGIHFYEVTESDVFGSKPLRKEKDRGDKHEKNRKKTKIKYEK